MGKANVRLTHCAFRSSFINSGVPVLFKIKAYL